MSESDVFEVGEQENITNYCSTCLRKSKNLQELKYTTTIEKFLSSTQKPILNVCSLCNLAIEFSSQFHRLCEISKVAMENWDVISIKSEYLQDETQDIKVQNALESVCHWVRRALDENTRICKTEEDMIDMNDGESEIDEDKMQAIVKTEILLEEYLVDSDHDPQIEVIEETEEDVNVVETPRKKSRKNEMVQNAQAITCGIDECQRKFIHQRSLNAHVEKVHVLMTVKTEKLPSKLYSCTEDTCNFTASSQMKLNRHFKEIHQLVIKKTFCCELCGKTVPTKCRLQYHMNTHLGISPFLCDFEGCTRAFRNPTRLRNHKQEFHLRVIRMHCSICGKGFRTKASHDLHILGHDKPTIPCEVCGRLLTNRKTLRTHLMTHTGERPYKCEIEGCNKAFTKCSGLQVHMRSHTKEKPYKCPQCTVNFAYKVSMKKHMLKYHDVPWETSTYIKPETQKLKIDVIHPEAILTT